MVPRSVIEQVDDEAKDKKKRAKARIARELARRDAEKEKKKQEEARREKEAQEQARKAKERALRKKAEEKRKEEEVKLEQERLRKREDWKKAKKVRKAKSKGKGSEYSLKASTYISSVYNGLTEYPPEISPLGDFVGDMKWSVQMEEDGHSVHGVIRKGLLSEPLQVTCKYRRIITLKQCNTIFTQAGKEASYKKRFQILCIVADNLPDGAKEALEVFNHPNFSPLMYEVSDQALFYPPNDEKLGMFLSWFKPDEKPKTLEELVKGVADEDGSFTREALVHDLGLFEEEAERLLDFLISQKKIVDVDRKSYAFVE